MDEPFATEIEHALLSSPVVESVYVIGDTIEFTGRDGRNYEVREV